MLNSDNLQNFSKAMKEGACSMQIPILDIPDYYDTVVQNLREQGCDTISNTVQSELRGICPICCTWLDSTLLFQPSMIRKEEVVLNGYGSIGRLLDGCCPNFECESKQVILIWKGSPDIKTLVENVFRLALENRKDEAVSRFFRQDVLSYAADAIWIQRRKEIPLHIYTGHKSRNGDICIWVSVMQGLPNEDEYKKRHFPDGYVEFMNRLLAESSYDSDNVAVMHWVHGYEAAKQATFMSFVDNRNNQRQKGWLLLPTDLLNNSELKRLGPPKND